MPKKHKGGDHGDIHADERWLITYADMITLLLAVFIVMYALSDTNLRKFNAFAQSLNAAFSTDVMAGSTQFTITEGQATTPDAGNSQAAVGMIGSEAQTVQTVAKNYAIQKGLATNLKVVTAANGLGLQIEAIRQIRGTSTNQVPGARVALANAGPMVEVASTALYGTREVLG